MVALKKIIHFSFLLFNIYNIAILKYENIEIS